MKKLCATLFLAGVIGLVFNACKKENHYAGENQGMALYSSPQFRQYVAVDMLSRVHFSVTTASKMDATEHADFKAKLQSASESDLPVLYQTHHLDYAAFQKHMINRLVRRVKALQALPSVASLPEAEIDRLFDAGYKQVANDIMLKIKPKLDDGLITGRKGIRVDAKKMGVNTVLEEERSDYLSDEFYDTITEEEAADQIATFFNETATDGLTAGEVWGCFKEALGFGAGTMVGILGWSRLSAGIAVQEIVSVVARWAVKHIGWIGAAVSAAEFGACLYDAL